MTVHNKHNDFYAP